MDKFEFFFALVALLLGLALTELASGLASALKARKRIRIGWVTPFAALAVCLDIASTWPAIWGIRDTLDVRSFPMIAATLMCLGYYVAASFVFPDSFEEGASLDDWYFANRWFSIGGTLALALLFNIVQLVLVPESVPDGVGAFLARYWGWMLYVLLYGIALAARQRWVVVGALGTTIALYPVYYLL